MEFPNPQVIDDDHDPRCCGTGTCIINAEGECWCGQRWDGEKMCVPPLFQSQTPEAEK